MKVLASIGAGILLAGTGIVATSAFINPYSDKGATLELTADSGIQKDEPIIIQKNIPTVIFTRWGDEEQLTMTATGTWNGFTRPLFSTTGNYDSVDGTKQANIEPATSTAGINFDITLNSIPTSNVFIYDLQGWQSMNFYYQPPLWQEEGLIAPTPSCTDTDCNGTHRDANVVGSYAVYSNNKKNQLLGGTNYATGKLFHIYRPLVTDAKGNSVWADLIISNGTLTVTVPQSFLNTATYPVKVDPTIGYTAVGASSTTIVNTIIGSTAVSSEAGTASAMSMNILGTGTTQNTKTNIYDSSNNQVTNGQTTSLVAVNGWNTYTFAVNPTITANTQYQIAGWSDSNTGTRLIAFDTITAAGFSQALTYGTWPAPLVPVNQNRLASIYLTYSIPSRTITTTNFRFCKTMTATAGGNSGGMATTSSLAYALYATTTDANLIATSSGGNVQLLNSTRTIPFDVVFTNQTSCYSSASATALPHYFERYASTTGAIVAAIAVDNISSTSAKVITMYYGNANATDLNTPGQTFATTSSLKPVGIFDLNFQNTATTTIPDFPDVTYNRSDGYSAAASSTDLVNGYLGGGFLTYDSSYGTAVNAGNTTPLSITAGTVMAWIKPNFRVAGNRHFFISKDNFSADRNGYLIGTNGGSNALYTEFASASAAQTSSNLGCSSLTIANGAWYHVAMTFDNTTLRGFWKGAACTAAGVAQTVIPVSNVNNFNIGRDAVDTTSDFDGTIDDVRVFSNVLDPMDILTIYNNTVSSKVFWTWGTQTLAPSASFLPNTSIRANVQLRAKTILR